MNRISKILERQWDKASKKLIPSQGTLRIAGIGILCATTLFFFSSQYFDFIGSLGVFPFILFACLYFLIGLTLAWVGSVLLGIAGRAPFVLRIAVLLAILCVFYYFHVTAAYGWLLLCFLVIWSPFIATGIYKWRKRDLFPLLGWHRYATFSLFIVGIVGFITSIVFFLHPGTPPKPTENIKMLAQQLPPIIESADPSQKGPYDIAFLTYGSGTDKRPPYRDSISIKTATVDGSLLLKSWTGISGKLRTWYFGFDNSQLPLNARVWYPKGRITEAPLILIVHGNHLAQDYSDDGYAYLGELLASRGYIMASIDENFLNESFTDFEHFRGGLFNENAARGWLLLKHLEQWRNWNSDSLSLFYHRVDLDRIALIGHSRGGEAVGHAAMFNKLRYFPDNANEVFDFNFNIRSIVMIAPVDGQYKPAAILTPLKDINYFVIHGSHDMDMESYGGLAPYKRLEFSPGFNGFKAGLYVHRANHGQFNSSWGQHDWTSPNIDKFNLSQLMNETDQQQIAKTYISSFLEVTLNDNPVYKPLFMDYRCARQWLPQYSYFNQFEGSNTLFVANFDEDMDLQSATLSGSTIDTENLSVWREEQHQLMWGGHLTKAAFIGWDCTEDSTLVGSYSITLPDSLPTSLGNRLLVFSLTESDESAIRQKREQNGGKPTSREQNAHAGARKNEMSHNASTKQPPIDFTIELIDKQQEKINFRLSTCSFLQPQIKKHITKFAFLNASPDSEAVPEFFYFDISTLGATNPLFKLNDLSQVRFVFDQRKSGMIILDDIGFLEREI